METAGREPLQASPGAQTAPRTGSGLLGALADIAAVTGDAHTVRDVVARSAPLARRALDADALSIGFWERGTGVLRILINDGYLACGRENFPIDETYRASEYPLLAIMDSDGRGHVDSLDDPDIDPGEAELLKADGMRHAVAVPVRVAGRVWGELYAARRPGRERFCEKDREAAVTVAAQIAAGIGQVRHLERVSRLAYEDPLTGLANRRAIDDHLDRAMEQHHSTGIPVSMVVCDVNDLKGVNDEKGHEAGDRLLMAVADAMSLAAASVRGALVGRLGGDEFCILIVGSSLAAAVEVANEVCRRSRELGGAGVACGVASTEDTGGYDVSSPSKLFRLADAAQYRAKRAALAVPVVAGWAVRGDTDPGGEDDPTAAGPRPTVERRGLRSRGIDASRALADGLAGLDLLAQRGNEPGGQTARAQEALTAIADVVARLVDASGWWLSRADLPARSLVTVANAMPRYSGEAAPWHREKAQVGATFDLDDYPMTDAAVRGGFFTIEVGRAGNDPAEELLVVASRSIGMVAAGASMGDVGWLLEIYADELSSSFEGAGPVLRALMATALASVAQVCITS